MTRGIKNKNILHRLPLLLLLLMPLPLLLHSQPPDSLLRVLEAGNWQGEEAALACAALGRHYQTEDPDTAIFFFNGGIAIAGEAGSSYAGVKNMLGLAEVYYRDGDLEQAAKYFIEARNGFDTYPDSSEMFTAYRLLGSIYFTWRQFYQTLETQQKAMEIATAQKDSVRLGIVYLNFGALQGELGQNDAALGYMRKALAYFGEAEPKFRGRIMNNIAMIHSGRLDYDSANYFFMQAVDLFRQSNDHYGMAHTYRSLGADALERGSLREAEEYLSQAYDQVMSPEMEGLQSAHLLANIYLLLSQVYAEQSRPVEARRYLLMSLREADRFNRVDIAENAATDLAKYHEERGRNDSAVYYYNLAATYADTLWKNKSDPRIEQLVFDMEMARQQETYDLREQLLREQMHRKDMNFLLILVIVISLLGGALTLARLYWSKGKRLAVEKQNVQLAREKAEQDLAFRDQELEFKKKELATQLLSMVQKNNLIEQVAVRLKEVLPRSGSAANKEISGLIRELQAENDKGMWKEFEKRFHEVNQEFYTRLVERYPGLTPNELKLCAYLYLNMSTKDIASITFQRNETIRIARHRLRKKLDLGPEENLVTFLHRISGE